MALLLRPAGCADLHVPLPAVATEFIDHDAVIHKVYVIGSKVRAVGRGTKDLIWMEHGCGCQYSGVEMDVIIVII